MPPIQRAAAAQPAGAAADVAFTVGGGPAAARASAAPGRRPSGSARRALPRAGLRALVLAALAFAGCSALWLAPAVSAGRRLPQPAQAEFAIGASTFAAADAEPTHGSGAPRRMLQIGSASSGAGGMRFGGRMAGLWQSSAPAFAAMPANTPLADAAAAAAGAQTAPAATAAVPTGGAAALFGLHPEAAKPAAVPVDQVALMAAQGMGAGGGMGGINMANTNPIAIDTPVDLYGGNYNYRTNLVGALGRR